MIKLVDEKRCNGCLSCVNICNQEAINVINKDGFYYVKVDNRKCINCKKCESVCPYLEKVKLPELAKCAIAYTTNEDIRTFSSSGGLFGLIALKTIENNGIVFGCAYDDNNECKHIYTDNVEGLVSIMGKKYTQSDISDSYKKCKEFLLNKKNVLFSGTPCQIIGLKNFLGQEYENLLCIEVGCDGVISNKVLKSYLEECDFPAKISNINKISGENCAGMLLEYNDESQNKAIKRSETNIHKCSSLGLGLRPSCIKCSFGKNISRADITIKRYSPTYENENIDKDRQAMNLIIIRTSKGLSTIDFCLDELNIKYLENQKTSSFLKNNTKTKPLYFKTKKFLKYLDKDSLDISIKKCEKTTIYDIILFFAKKFFIK